MAFAKVKFEFSIFLKVKFNSRQNESFAIFLSFINTTPIEPLLQNQF